MAFVPYEAFFCVPFSGPAREALGRSGPKVHTSYSCAFECLHWATKGGFNVEVQLLDAVRAVDFHHRCVFQVCRVLVMKAPVHRLAYSQEGLFSTRIKILAVLSKEELAAGLTGVVRTSGERIYLTRNVVMRSGNKPAYVRTYATAAQIAWCYAEEHNKTIDPARLAELSANSGQLAALSWFCEGSRVVWWRRDTGFHMEPRVKLEFLLDALPLLDDAGVVMPGQEHLYAAVQHLRWERRKHIVCVATAAEHNFVPVLKFI